MFDKFGEMGSYEEINMAAEGFFNEGDMESLRELAKENGIPEDFVQMYITGDVPELCDPFTAAVGKLDVERKDVVIAGLMEDWVKIIKGLCMEDDEIAIAVRKKGKTLIKAMAELLRWQMTHAEELDKRIAKELKIKYPLRVGTISMAKAKELLETYYRGK